MTLVCVSLEKPAQPLPQKENGQGGQRLCRLFFYCRRVYNDHTRACTHTCTHTGGNMCTSLPHLFPNVIQGESFWVANFRMGSQGASIGRMGVTLWGKFMTLAAYDVTRVSCHFHNNLQGVYPLNNNKEVGNVMSQVALSAAEAPDSCSRPCVQSGSTDSPQVPILWEHRPYSVHHPLSSPTFSWVVHRLAHMLPYKLRGSITWGPRDVDPVPGSLSCPQTLFQAGRMNLVIQNGR